MKIITNNHKRPILSSYDIPVDILANDFSWTDESEQFVKYRGNYYALSEFVRLSKRNNSNPWLPEIIPELENWTGKHDDSFFSSVLIRIDYWDSDHAILGLCFA